VSAVCGGGDDEKLDDLPLVGACNCNALSGASSFTTVSSNFCFKEDEKKETYNEDVG